MGIFETIARFCEAPVKAFLEQAATPVRKTGDVINGVKRALDLIDNVLDAVGRNLDRLAKIVGDAADSLKYNPLGTGPLKIVLKLVSRFLRVAESALRALSGLADGIKAFFRGTVRNRINKALDDLAEKVLDVILLISDIKLIANRIQRVARKLAEQEHLLLDNEKSVITGKFHRLFYAPIPPLEAAVKSTVAKLEPIRRHIEVVGAQIADAKRQLDAISSIIASFTATVGAVLDRIASIGRRVKAWIDEKIAFLGWLLDGVEWVIDEAMSLFGIDKLMDWVKEKLGNVPFIREARQFLDLMEQAQREIESKIAEYMNELKALETQLKKEFAGSVGFVTNKTFQYIIEIVIRKLNAERKIPDIIRALIEELRSLGNLSGMEPSEEETGETERKTVDDRIDSVEAKLLDLKERVYGDNPEFFPFETKAIRDKMNEHSEEFSLVGLRKIRANPELFRKGVSARIVALGEVSAITDVIREKTKEFEHDYFAELAAEIPH